jgi:cell division protein ZapA (FtsZ GTPase activity inhibitor)
MSEVSIQIKLGNSSYPLNVKEADKENLLKAADMVNRSIKSLESQYGIKIQHDLFAMTALQFATQIIDNKIVDETDDKSFEKIELELDNLITLAAQAID